MKIKEILNCDNVYFTSDTHFYHTNIIKYCSRSFKDVSHMNCHIIDKWNEVIPIDSIVFHLGDFSFSGSNRNKELLDRLNGSIHFIMGNHDRPKEISKLGFASVSDLLEITVKDPEITGGYQKIVLCHYPILSFHGAHKGYWHLFGHCHGNLVHPHPCAIDVGVDCWDFAPISYNKVKEFLTRRAMQKKFTPLDHHGETER